MARDLGVTVQLQYLNAPLDELHDRIAKRTAEPVHKGPGPLPIISFRVRHERTERSAAADRMEATLANEPTEKADKNDPIEPIERTDPTEAIERIEPREPIHKIELSDLIDSSELWRVLTSPIMSYESGHFEDLVARIIRRCCR